MRLASYRTPLGIRLAATRDATYVDVNAAYSAMLRSRGIPHAEERANVEVPSNARDFLMEGAAAIHRADNAIGFALEQTEGVRYVYDERDVRLAPVIPEPSKIICLGLNYRDHAEEAGMPLPEHPVIFSKYANALIASKDPIVLPRVTKDIDYEGELCVVMGQCPRYVTESEAESYVAGYTILNDVSARDYQLRTSQWLPGKTFDRSTPVGPVLVTSDEIADPQGLDIKVTLNGKTVQNSNTRNMVFSIQQIIAFVSEIMTLEPGDLIATGTPAGVGFVRNPPLFMKAGDKVEVSIERLGVLENDTVDED